MAEILYQEKKEKFRIMDIYRFPRRWMVRYGDELILLGLSLFLFMVATNTQVGWLFVVISLILGLLVMGFLFSWINTRKMSIQRSFPDICQEGEEVRVNFMVRNESRIPKYFILLTDSFPSLEPEIPEKPFPFPLPPPPPQARRESVFIPYIPGKGTVSVSYKVECYRRGIYRFGPVYVESGGFFGFFEKKKPLKDVKDDRIIILPQTYPIDKLFLNNVSPFRAREDRTFLFTGRSQDFIGVREYVPGEETRFIHWPLTAKHNRLMVKEFSETASHSMTVVIDNHKDSSTGEGRENSLEYMIRAGASLLKWGKKHNYTFNLFYGGENEGIYLPNLSLEKGLYSLADIAPESLPQDQMQEELEQRIKPLDHIFLFRGYPFESLEGLKRIKDKRVVLTVIFVNPLSFSPKKENKIDYQKEQLEEMGINVIIIQKGESLSSILSSEKVLYA